MSWTRRFLVLVAFALMLAGVALMVTEKDELFLVLSVAGFALVLAAVPSLPKEPAEDELVHPRAAGGDRTDAGGPGRAETVTVPSNAPEEAPTDEQEALSAPAAAAAEDSSAAASGPRESGTVAGERSAPPAAPAEVKAEPEPQAAPEAKQVAEPALAAGAGPEAELRSPAGVPKGSERTPEPPPAALGARTRQGGATGVSARGVAATGAAVGAVLWLWRRLRR